MDSKTEYSIVVPVFNEEPNIEILISSILTVLTKESPNFELILIDDGSKDKSFEKIDAWSKKDNRVKGLSFSRNFGHQIALTAGLEMSKGNAIITMDGDMQHPPAFIPELIKKHKEGFDIVNTKRIDAKSTGIFKKLTSRWYYKLINYLSTVQIDPASADFRLMSRKAVKALTNLPERDRFTRGLVKWIGFRQTSIDYTAQERHSGATKYTFFKMLKLALDGIISFSGKPLRLAVLAGFFVILAGLVYGLFAIVMFISGQTVAGWTSILLTVLFLGGFQLLSLGIMGEYIIRIFNEAKARPLYIIGDKTDNLE